MLRFVCRPREAEILEQGFAGPGVFGRPFPQAQDVLFPVVFEAERHQHDVILEVDPVDHQHCQAQLRQIATLQLHQASPRPFDETPADSAPAFAPFRHLDWELLQRVRVASGRDAQDHLLEGPLLQRVLPRPLRPGRQLDLTTSHRPNPRARQRHPTSTHNQRPGSRAMAMGLTICNLLCSAARTTPPAETAASRSPGSYRS